jgi:predicted transcriptional regulator
LEIFAEILELCRKPNVKTRVMYKTNLSYGMLQVCLEQLLKQELLELNLSAKNYSTTEKGLDFLQTWTTLQQFTITP